MATREELLRDLILSPRGQLTIPSANADRETRKAIRELTEGDNPRADYAAGMLDLTAHPDDERLNADQQHNVLAAARNVLLHVTTPTREDAIATHFASSGFTSEMVRDGVNFLRRDRLATRRDGVVTVTVPAPAKRPALPADLLAPRNSAPSTTSTSTSAPANRPNMPVGNLIEHPDQHMSMAARLRAQAQAMPSASFEVGDVPAAASTGKEKPTAVAIPDSVLVAYIDAITSAFARYGKPSATWRELGVRLPPADLPEGSTKQTTAAAALDKLAEGGTIRHESGVYTHVPAECAVAGLTEWIGESAKAGVLITPAAARALAQREDVQKLTPNGWNATTLVALAMDAVVTSGVIERVEGGYIKPAPEPVAPASEPKPAETPESAGDTTSTKSQTEPEGTAPVAPASGHRAEGEKSETPPAAKPVSIPGLEKKVDVLTGEVRAIGARLHTLPPPPTKEQVMLADASPEARHLLEKILVQLKVKQRVVEEENEKKGKKDKGEQHFAMTRDDLKSRMPGRARVTATNPNPPDYRKHVLAALELGRAMGVIEYTEKWLGGSYVFITHVNVMSRAELDRRVQRILDIRKARAEKSEDAA